ncbi:MAG: Fic family protein [Phycisphaerales bacterium]|nr:Fic family protein [Phycisphaerales bacterium]
MDDEQWAALVEAKSRLMLVEGAGQRLMEPAMLLRPLQRREAIRSSAIEDIDATAEELLLFELDDPREAVEGLREVANYERALRLGVERLGEIPLSLRLVRELHAALLVGVRGADKTPGEFRRVQVSIGDRFVPPPPSELPDCLDAFERAMHGPIAPDPLIAAFWLHYQFETIHPFCDGNGRVGRLLLALSVMSMCGLGRPWLYMSAYFDRHRARYMDLLYRVSTEGAWREWTLFCLRGVADQAVDTARRIDRLLGLRDRYRRRLAEAGVKARVLDTLDELFASPVLTVPIVESRRGVDYKTAKADVARLIDAGILSEVPGRKPVAYLASAILAAANDDDDRQPQS